MFSISVPCTGNIKTPHHADISLSRPLHSTFDTGTPSLESFDHLHSAQTASWTMLCTICKYGTIRVLVVRWCWPWLQLTCTSGTSQPSTYSALVPSPTSTGTRRWSSDLQLKSETRKQQRQQPQWRSVASYPTNFQYFRSWNPPQFAVNKIILATPG